MSVRLLLAAALALPAPAAAARADLSRQFPPERWEGNAQGAVNACQSFAAAALLEAALWREASRRPAAAAGPRARLSEADLFARGILAGPWAGLAEEAWGPQGARPGPLRATVFENGFVEPLLGLALERGVAPAEDLPYRSFYAEYREEVVPRIQARRAAGEDSEGAALDELALFVSRLDSPRARAGRAAMKTLLAGLSRYGLSASARASEASGAAALCRDEGAKLAAFAAGELLAGRPLAATMELAGLPAWGRRSARSAPPVSHAFVLTGFEDRPGPGEAPRRVFLTLNSPFDPSAPAHPEVPEEDFCRVSRLDGVLAPGDGG